MEIRDDPFLPSIPRTGASTTPGSFFSLASEGREETLEVCEGRLTTSTDATHAALLRAWHVLATSDVVLAFRLLLHLHAHSIAASLRSTWPRSRSSPPFSYRVEASFVNPIHNSLYPPSPPSGSERLLQLPLTWVGLANRSDGAASNAPLFPFDDQEAKIPCLGIFSLLHRTHPFLRSKSASGRATWRMHVTTAAPTHAGSTIWVRARPTRIVRHLPKPSSLFAGRPFPRRSFLAGGGAKDFDSFGNDRYDSSELGSWSQLSRVVW